MGLFNAAANLFGQVYERATQVAGAPPPPPGGGGGGAGGGGPPPPPPPPPRFYALRRRGPTMMALRPAWNRGALCRSERPRLPSM